MFNIIDKKTLFQDRYQALMLPVTASGIHRHRLLLKMQGLFPDHHTAYKNACEKSELTTGNILVFQPQRDLSGISVGGALSKPRFIVDMAVMAFSENPPNLRHIESCLQKLSPIFLSWGRYQGIRRVALLATDELFLPENKDFHSDILPLLEKYLKSTNDLTVTIYR